MDGSDVSSDQVMAELFGMGFDFPDIVEAIKAVGPSLDNAIEFILNDSRRESGNASNCSGRVTGNTVLGKRPASSLQSSGRMRQQNITEHLGFASGPQKSKTRFSSIVDNSVNHYPETPIVTSICKDEEGTEYDWEPKVKDLLLRHYGFSTLKNFQKEVIGAWLANQDSLVLAATGSGKSLCFQVPALLSGKVVVVISPLISLMHDQCLKLGKHGISSCFLGYGQVDKSVENKAMSGAYNIIYVCPETILRLITPLQSLAESRGIALFAIDEVHCVSKWGHDFRPDYRPRDLNRLLVNFQSTLQEITVIATQQSSVPPDAADQIGGKAVELRSYIDPTKENDSSLHTQLWIDPTEEFVQYSHMGDPVDVTFGVKELKAFLSYCEGCEVDIQLHFDKAGEPILMAPKFGLDDGSCSNFDASLVLATMLTSQLNRGSAEPQLAANNEAPRAQQGSKGNASEHPSDHTRIWSDLSASGTRNRNGGGEDTQNFGERNQNTNEQRTAQRINEMNISRDKNAETVSGSRNVCDRTEADNPVQPKETNGQALSQRHPSNWVDADEDDDDDEGDGPELFVQSTPQYL